MMETLAKVAGDVIVGAASVLFGIVLYAVIFRPGLIVRKR